MSSTLLRRLRALERLTRLRAHYVPAEWREPFRVTDYWRPVELIRFNRGLSHYDA
jgi:hypothetical protein